MHNFRKLKVWQKSIDASINIYKATDALPKSEMYGLTSQMRRAVVSIASNIAEGAGRGTATDFSHFLDIAQGSTFELETQLIISNLLGYLSTEKTEALKADIIEIQK